ncbi:hypothetical protein FRC03_000026 [Tulasnella sp. 419]|nr:hypothetical protein FRC03_000026 [Tulasnella sp. 419]
MISDLVITSLLYPALAIYFSSQPLSHYSTRLHDSLFALGTRADTTPTDLRDIWEVYDTLHIREETGVQARCGAGRTIRLERVLVPGVNVNDPFGSLTKQSLLFTLHLQQQINNVLSLSTGNDLLRCITDPEKPTAPPPNCLVYGPLIYWDDEADLLEEANVIAKINSQQNLSKAGIPIDVEMTLGGRGPKDGRGWVFNAEFLALTYFFVENDCHNNVRHSSWLNALNSAASSVGGTVRSTAHSPKLIALEYDVVPRKNRISLLTIIVYLAYFTLVGYFSGPLRKMDTVHSRFGLAFTGIVEIVASTITSVSVCALWGFRVTMVPWGILPVMIVFVGAEDMFSLVQAVVATSISLPVKERIALGLSKAGASNTLKVTCYNAIFGTIAVFSTGAIRQFCIFTVVVLVAHWFLIHTFFVAVLAIDIQRLDLADFLRQGPRHVSPKGLRTHKASKSTSEKIPERAGLFRKDRLAKNGSFILLLAMTATLYFVSSPFSDTTKDNPLDVSRDAARSSFIQSFGTPFPTAVPDGSNINDIVEDPPQTPSPAKIFWTVLNPSTEALLHLRVESPALVTFQSTTQRTEDITRQPSHAFRSLIRGLRPLLWIFRIIVLPMSCTAIVLYALMLYLLKDADLVDAQRNRMEADSPGSMASVPVGGRGVNQDLSFMTLPRTFVADVELGAVSQDGTVVVSVSVYNEITVWMRSQSSHYTLDVGSLVAGIGDNSTSLTVSAIVLDEVGSRCAVGFRDGLVIQWSLASGVRSRTSVRDGTQSPVVKLLFCDSSVSLNIPSSSTRRWNSSRSGSRHLLIAHRGGETYVWNTADEARAVMLKTSKTQRNAPPSFLVTDNGAPQILFPLEDGGIEILFAPQEVRDVLRWESKVIPSDESKEDPIICITSSSLLVGSVNKELFALARHSGRIEVRDVTQGNLVASIDDGYEAVSKMALSSFDWKTCQHCGEREPDSFALSLSCSTVVHVYKVVVALQANRCACPMLRRNTFSAKAGNRDKQSARQSRSGSMVSSSTSSPRAHRQLLPNPTASQTLDYPIAAHGYHSRRISEKDAKDRSRASTETMNSDDLDSIDFPWSDPFAPSSGPDASSTPRVGFAWSNSRVVKLLEIPCERGGWGTSSTHILGIRRCSRSSENGAHSSSAKDSKISRVNGISESVLSRWELWTFNPSEDALRISSLRSLKPAVPPSSMKSDPSEECHSDLVRRNSTLRCLLDLKRKDDAARSLRSVDGMEPTSLPINSQHPLLSFTRIFPVEITGQTLLAGLGNTIGLVDLSCLLSHANAPSRKTSFTRSDINSIERKRQ